MFRSISEARGIDLDKSTAKTILIKILKFLIHFVNTGHQIDRASLFGPKGV